MVYMDFPHSSVGRESTCNAGDPCSIPGAGGSPGKGIGYPLQYSCSLVAQLVKNHLQCEDLGSIPGLGRSPGEGKIYPLQYSALKNSTDCICIVHGVAKSRKLPGSSLSRIQGYPQDGWRRRERK